MWSTLGAIDGGWKQRRGSPHQPAACREKPRLPARSVLLQCRFPRAPEPRYGGRVYLQVDEVIDKPFQRQLLHTIHSAGYRLADLDAESAAA